MSVPLNTKDNFLTNGDYLTTSRVTPTGSTGHTNEGRIHM
jgi:hypothetical protein